MLDIQDSPSSSSCEKDWLEIGGVKWVSIHSKDWKSELRRFIVALVCDRSYWCMCTCVCLCVFYSTLRLCNPIGDSSRKRIYSSPVLLHFHSDESLTHKGFYLVYRAFSPESSEHTILLCFPSVCWMYDNVWALFCKATWLWFVLWSAFVVRDAVVCLAVDAL